ncbi:FeoC-like transcriptional regulator [Pseudogemmobacter blasticus]|uniref:Transcriptional regulator HTH-type FeoC domain-containing protein n=1 Tax=Fuscovulum blasticum DSM 2131 TaxID=1188250 RepID=A0A2T4JD91_FUSBL|nr:FeoC-like transcriptional regulator [Fuscovulum blasticum]PTE15861.1 hypothetical protein C5F44_02130 [Fuscovulum blasticum DSM 2131]
MLLAIRSLIQTRGQASLSDLALHFRVSPEAMQGMVEHWVAKGQVRRQSCGSCSGGCGGCPSARAADIYLWTGPDPRSGS